MTVTAANVSIIVVFPRVLFLSRLWKIFFQWQVLSFYMST